MKRKASEAAENPWTKSLKRSSGTLDAFFSPRQPAPSAPKTTHTHGSLSSEQNRVLEMVVQRGENVFFTGPAGTGKSLLLRSIIAALRAKYEENPEAVSVCASTGMAAQNIGGTTIHAWGAVTPNVFDIGKQMSYIKTCRPAHRRWKSSKVLIIDEVSMVDGQFFDLLSALAIALRKKTARPFGGIQLIVTGDFFQLPPVTQGGKEPVFAFQSDAWKTSIKNTVVLSQVFRQKDSHFVDLLNEMRKGELPVEAKKTLAGLSRPLPFHDGLLPTELFPLRTQVERANAFRMTALGGPSYKFESRDSGAAAPEKRRKLLENMVAVNVLELKVNAQVMLVKNINETLVNGTVGKVLGFEKSTDKTRSKDDELLPLIEFRTLKGKEVLLVSRDEFRAEDSEGKLLARRVQIPLVLAWAMSIHKAQGQTIQRIRVDLSKVFEKGQSYVALSRAATLEGLQVLGFDARKVVAHPRVIEWSRGLQDG